MLGQVEISHEHSCRLSGITFQPAGAANMRKSPSPSGEGDEAQGSLQSLLDYVRRSVAAGENEKRHKCREQEHL